MLRLSLLLLLAVVAINAWDTQLQLNNEYPLSNDVVPFFWNRLFGLGKRSDENLQDRIVCDTDECKFIAEIMKVSMDESVDPCEDFHEFACGNWPDSDLRPENSTIPYSLWSLVQKKIENRMEGIKNRQPKSDDPFYLRIMNKFHKTCMDTQSIEDMGLEPLVSALSKAGGWPMIMESDEWSEEVFPWQKVDDYYASLTGDNFLYKIGIFQTNESSFALLVQKPPLPKRLSEPFDHENSTSESEEEGSLIEENNRFYNQEIDNAMDGENSAEKSEDEDCNEDNLKNEYKKKPRDKYANYITEVALAIAENAESKVSRQRIKQDADDLVQFIIDLSKIADVYGDYEAPVWTLNELQSWYNELNPETPNSVINWVDKVLKLVNEANINADGDMPVMLTVKEYVTKLVPLLNKTPPRTIVNYIHWNFLSNAIYLTTKKMRNLHDNWELTEKEENEEDRQKWCDAVIDRNILFNIQYIQEYYNKEYAEKVEDMFKYLIRAVEAEVLKSKWMDEWAKTFLFEKAGSIKDIIGLPEWFTNVTAINRSFQGFVVGPTFFDNYYLYATFKRRRLFGHICDPDRDISFVADALVLNAFYGMNQVEIPAGDLQCPLYGSTWPSVVNYGIMGYVLGHEINHGYGPEGRLYDKNGKLTKWLTAMGKEYMKRAKCFVNQYDNYANQLNPDDPVENYGNKTLGENISDTMGLEASYNGFKISLKESLKPESTLPGFERYTSDQIFFISFANSLCASTRNESIPDASRNDVHSTGKLRIWGTVSNSPNFAKAFNCASGTPMNPKRKCNLWD